MYLDFKVGKANGSAWVDFDPDDPTVGYYGQTTFAGIVINNKQLGSKYNERLERIMLDALNEFFDEQRAGRFDTGRVFTVNGNGQKWSAIS